MKVVRLLVPFSAGSGSDTIGRIYANGNIGAEVAMRAPADGYTLFLVNMAHAVNVSMSRKLAYDPVRDLKPSAE